MLLGSVVAGLTIWPWFSTGWLMIISTTLESNAYGVVYSDDPQANTLAGWLFYPQRLPELLSWPLLTMAAIAWGLLIVDALLRWRNAPMTLNWLRLDEQRWASLNRWIWPLAFIVGVYFLFTLGTNKRLRFVLPLLPVIWIVLCQGVVSIRHRGWRWGRWLAVGLSFYLTVSQLFVGAARPQYAPGDWPNRSVIGEMVATAPYLRPNLGIAVNTAEVNAFNMNFYGAAANFQVFARQVGLSLETAVQDAQALDWYLTKTGEQGVYGTIEAGQQVLAEAIATSPEMAIQRTWPLPDGSTLNLHHRQQTPITVRPIEPESTAAIGDDPVRLLDVQVAEQIKPGATYPITYTWQGGAALEPGLVLLTWKPESPASTAEQQSDRPVWISDHALGLGYLNTRSAGLTEAQAFEVEERLTLQPPENLSPGPYQLEVTYLNRETGEATAIASDPVRVVIAPQAAAPEREREGGDRDLFTFFRREMAPKLQTGELDPVFFEVGRINQYDPQQDYLNQVEQAMTYRLSQVPNQLDWLYALTLTHVLQQDGPGAIAALETITQVAPDNAYNWLHLGFVYLYSWQPGQAQRALAEAERQQPNLPNLALLKTVNAVMGLNIPEAIRLLRSGT